MRENRIGMEITYYIPSLSSPLMNGVTTWRNLHKNREIKIKAEVGYALIALIAVVESAIATLFCIASCLFLPFSSGPFKHNYQWLKSSAFCIVWSVASYFLNPFVNKLVEYEGEAKGYPSYKFVK